MTTIPRASDTPLPDAAEGVRIGRAQRSRLLAEAERLTDQQWRARTECPRWTVLDMVAHVVAATENTARPHRMALGLAFGPLRHRGDSPLDAMNEVGIDRRRGWAADRLLADFRRAIPTAASPSWFRPLPIRGFGLPPHTTGATMADVILVRDVWLHRHDIARATGTIPDADATDALVVAQVVRDLGRSWTGPSTLLALTGPEGGTWVLGPEPGSLVALPAVDFMRHLSGRRVPQDLFEGVPDAVRPALTAARVAF